MERRDFFISYTKRDKAWAVWVANVLKSCGYTVYMQEMDIKPGENFIELMNGFLKHSGSFIAVWSKAYSESRFCMTEMQAAFSEWHKKRMECFLIVCVDKHPVEPLYSALVHVDLPNKSAASEEKLADAVQAAVPPSAPEPEPPTPEKSLDSKPSKSARDKRRKFVWIAMCIDLVLIIICIRILWNRINNMQARELCLNGVVCYERENYSEARDYYEQAAKKGYAPALYNLGSFYQDGLGVGVDYAKARDYYEQAAAKGDASALNQLGWLYDNGLGVDVNYEKARDYYEQAAAKGNASALNNLGWLYEHGKGVYVDYEKALDYYQKAADAGYEDAAEKVEKLRAKLAESSAS